LGGGGGGDDGWLRAWVAAPRGGVGGGRLRERASAPEGGDGRLEPWVAAPGGGGGVQAFRNETEEGRKKECGRFQSPSIFVG
jgi:hypothetical protein